MKVLMIHNQAGVSSVLAKYLRREGIEVDVVKRAGFDKYGIEAFYGTKEIKNRARLYLFRVALKAIRYDLVHIHSIVSWFWLLIRKPIVFHFHGSDIRRIGLKEKVKLWIVLKICKVEKVFVATPDLESVIDSEWLPNPVDTEHFYRREFINQPQVKDYMTNSPISHEDFPKALSSIDVYTQDPEKVWALSKTSLESLACRTPVLWNGLFIDCELPLTHRPEYAVNRLVELYRSILGVSA